MTTNLLQLHFSILSGACTRRRVIAISILLLLSNNAFGYQLFTRLDGQPYKWNLAKIGSIPWQVSGGGPALVRESMLFATQMWSEATGGALTFIEGPGGIDVEWDPTGAKLPSLLMLGVAFFKADRDGNITQAQIIINAAAYTWQRGGFGGVGFGINGEREANLDSVMLHELGHAIGIDHSDKNSANIVGAWDPTNLPTMNSALYPCALTLHADDCAAVCKLYGGETPYSFTHLLIAASITKGTAPLKVSLKCTGADDEIAWDFGNGHKTLGSDTANARYAAPGIYTVTATFRDKSGTCTIEVTKKTRRKRLPKKAGGASYGSSIWMRVKPSW